MRALVDADIFCYEIGTAKSPTEEGLPLEWPLVVSRLDERITSIIEATECSSWQGYLTGKNNFRNEVATILPYKGNRNRDDRPFWYQAIYNHLRDYYPIEVIDDKEADDAISLEHNPETTIICSRDKDLKQLHGWHYSWPSWKQDEKLYYISELDARRFLWKQMLTGDSADNILGLYGVGPKSDLVKKLDSMDNEEDMWKHVAKCYHDRFGNYGYKFFEETLILLKLQGYNHE